MQFSYSNYIFIKFRRSALPKHSLGTKKPSCKSIFIIERIKLVTSIFTIQNIYGKRNRSQYEFRFHPHKIPLPLLSSRTALPHPDAGRVLPGKQAAWVLRHDAPRHRQEAGECAFHGEGRYLAIYYEVFERDMKILVLSSSFPRYTGDFAGNFVYELTKRLKDNFLSAIILSPHDFGAKFQEIWVE